MLPRLVGDRNSAGLFAGHDLRAIGQADEDARVHRDLAQVERHQRFLHAVEHRELALVAFAIGGDVVKCPARCPATAR